MKIDTYWKVMAITLLAINTALIFLLVRVSKPMMPPSERKPEGHRIIEVLRFDDNQAEAFDKLMHHHHLEMRSLTRDQSAVLKEYFDQLHSKNRDSPSQEKFDRFNAIEAEKLRLTYQHFLDIRAICTDEQLEYYELALDDLLRVVTEGGHRPPPPHGHPPHGAHPPR